MSENKLSRLIILGAGASVECGFYPTGAQFAQVVRRIWESNKGSQDFLQNPNFRYMENFLLSNHASIDSHISYIDNEEEKNFLKALIVSIILASTAYSALHKDFENNWYHELAKLIFPTVSNEKTNEERLASIAENLQYLQIITFNYDMSLELYLAERARAFFKNSDESFVQKFLGKILEKIYHVYGGIFENEFEIVDVLLGQKKFASAQLVEQWFDGFKTIAIPRFFSFSEFLDSFKKSFNDLSLIDRKSQRALLKQITDFSGSLKSNEISNRIKVINEDRGKNSAAKNEDQKLDEITQKAEGWDVLYVLGYGFDPLNNERLRLKELKWNKGCFVTNYDSDKNQKLERWILDDLLSEYRGRPREGEPKRYFIPLISHKSVSSALKEDFSLFENPKSPLEIQTNLTPYFELKK